MEKCLLVVDVQNDFVTGVLGSAAAQGATANIIKKLKTFEGRVIFTRDTHHSNYLRTREGIKLPIEHCIEGSQGWLLVEELDKYAAQHGSKIYNKPSFGNIDVSRDIAALFNSNIIDTLEIVGLDTDICVVSNALMIKALAPEMPIFVDSKCCAGSTPERHEAALETMRACHIDVD